MPHHPRRTSHPSILPPFDLPLTLPRLHRDLPPAKGFGAIKYKRNLPTRGPAGIVIFGIVGAVCAFGFVKVGQGNLEKR